MRFELHCHTTYSNHTLPWDAVEKPADMVRQARRTGLTGIAITDHDAIGGWKEAETEAKRQGIEFIPGIEVSSSEGHILAIGVSGPIKKGVNAEETVERIHESGGVAIAAHPYDIRGHGIRDAFRKTDAAEVFNALSLDRFSNRLTKSRAFKAGMPMVSGSDAHSLNMVGTAAVNANAHDLDSLIKAIKKGKVEIEGKYVPLNEMKEWNRRRMIIAYMDVVRYIDSHYGMMRAWALKNMMRRFIFSSNVFWDFVARFGLLGAMGYGGLKVLTYY